MQEKYGWQDYSLNTLIISLLLWFMAIVGADRQRVEGCINSDG
jgi:hypothetical protein